MTVAPITNFLTNQSWVNLAENSAKLVSCETGLKAVGRPSFILIDKDLDTKTKRYAAMKEFLYQLICWGVYLLVIPFVFKQGTFAIAKKCIFKNTKGFEYFKNSKEFVNYRKLADLDFVERQNLFAGEIEETITDPRKVRVAQKRLNTLTTKADKFKDRPKLYDALKSEKPEKYDLLYGTVETGSYIGSLLGLAILAPEIGHHLIHPILRVLGMEEKPDKASKKVDTKA